MARIRSIHPGLCSDPEFVGMSDSAQLFYLLLLTDCDDQGVFEWKPTQLKMRLRPASMAPVDPLLEEMVRADKVTSYEMGGRKYGVVRNFRKYQRPKKPNATFVLPPEFRTFVGLSAPGSELGGDKALPVPQKGELGPQMEDGGGRVEDGGGNYPPPTAREDSQLGGLNEVPDGWQCPNDLAEQLCGETGHSRADIEREAAKFESHSRAHGHRFADIRAAFRKWYLSGADRRARSGRDPGPRSGTGRTGTVSRAEAGRNLIAKLEAADSRRAAALGERGHSGGGQAPVSDAAGAGTDGPLCIPGPGRGSERDGDVGLAESSGAVPILRSRGGVPCVAIREGQAQASDAGGHSGEGGDPVAVLPRAVADGEPEIPAYLLRKA